jgi:hypothetical protein
VFGIEHLDCDRGFLSSSSSPGGLRHVDANVFLKVLAQDGTALTTDLVVNQIVGSLESLAVAASPQPGGYAADNDGDGNSAP